MCPKARRKEPIRKHWCRPNSIRQKKPERCRICLSPTMSKIWVNTILCRMKTMYTKPSKIRWMNICISQITKNITRTWMRCRPESIPCLCMDMNWTTPIINCRVVLIWMPMQRVFPWKTSKKKTKTCTLWFHRQSSHRRLSYRMKTASMWNKVWSGRTIPWFPIFTSWWQRTRPHPGKRLWKTVLEWITDCMEIRCWQAAASVRP